MIYFQSWLRPHLTPVLRNCDYEIFQFELDRVDQNIRKSGIESLAVKFALEFLPKNTSESQKRNRAEFGVVALRMEILRHLLGLPSLRNFSKTLAGSPCYADFCGILDITGIKWSSKSSLDRASKFFTSEQMQQFNALLTKVACDDDSKDIIDLENAIDCSVCLVDSTCLETNIHPPADWVLLRDVSRTLLKAIKLIRTKGLRHRMGVNPEFLAKQMNRLCIEMTEARRVKDAAKKRKSVLRRMKKLLKNIGEHAVNHRELLSLCYMQIDLSKAQADQVLNRIDDQVSQLPLVINQAHERIIGNRPVKNKDKILSVYQKDIHVLVRGKAGKEVEFGNALFINESPDGFILDYFLYKDYPPSEGVKLSESIKRLEKHLNTEQSIKTVVGDRGFDSEKMSKELIEAEITNHICPRNIEQLTEAMKDSVFRKNQTRRAGTEARIAILKNKGGGRVCRAKGFNNRSIQIAWGVLSHNLLWIAKTHYKIVQEKLPYAA